MRGAYRLDRRTGSLSLRPVHSMMMAGSKTIHHVRTLHKYVAFRCYLVHCYLDYTACALRDILILYTFVGQLARLKRETGENYSSTGYFFFCYFNSSSSTLK